MPGFSEAELLKLWAELLAHHPEISGGKLVMQTSGVTYLDSEGRKLNIDFLQNRELYGRMPIGKNELLAKAIGYKKGVERVLDATAGLGSDSLFMARMGLQVQATERNALIYFLISQARWMALAAPSHTSFEVRTQEALQRLEFLAGDLLQVEASPTEIKQPDAIFIDPMYPHTNKTALPRQEMVVFRNLVGGDEDSVQLLERCLRLASARVVVKRPIKGEFLGHKPDHSFAGKTVRYDLYMVK